MRFEDNKIAEILGLESQSYIRQGLQRNRPTGNLSRLMATGTVDANEFYVGEKYVIKEQD